MKHVTRIAIIGGGPGGYEAALVAAQLGADVTVVERDGPGGACVLTDCVPSKTLIATSTRMATLSESASLGVRFSGGADGQVGGLEVDPPLVNKRVRELAWAQMKTCYDPEIPINIVDLGLVYDCTVQPNEDGTRTIEVRLTLTAPGCGMGEILVDDVKDKIERIPTVREARVELTFDPPWNQSMMSEEARLQTGMYY